MLRSRNGFVTLLVSLSILILLTFNVANAQQSSLSITLTVSPLSGRTPFSPSYQFSYSGAVGSVRISLYWGDGSSSDLTYCGSSCPGHTYTIHGTYTITISITDSTGSTASDSKTITVYSAPAQATYNIQVGAWGDDASRGNTGVGAEIRTSIFSLASQDSAVSFWVGDNLQNGAFIQFGYELFGSSGNYCLYGEAIGDSTNCLGTSDTIGYNDARWFWQYWPNPKVIDFYFGIGPANSVALDGSWHLYQIWPNVANGWNFVLDGQSVWSFNNYQVTKSKDPAFVVAEEVTNQPSASGNLGPVEFRNLSYWTSYGWQPVTSLSAISGCGIISPNCVTKIYGISVIPYGVTVLGANDIITGTGEQLRADGASLWPQTFMLTLTAPTGVQVTIDGDLYSSGALDVPLLQGSHSLSVPEIFQIDGMNRLRFVSWSDGATDLSRIIDLSSDITLQAIYARQYKLTVVSPFPVSGDGWYDRGTSASFSSNTMPQLTNTLGVMIFVGWHDETGNLVTVSGAGSIMMDGPHTLNGRWLRFDYVIPIALVMLLGITLVQAYRTNKKAQEVTSESVEQKGEDDSVNRHRPSISPPSSLIQEPKPLPEFIDCRYCRAKIRRGSTKCSECGLTVRYLGKD